MKKILLTLFAFVAATAPAVAAQAESTDSMAEVWAFEGQMTDACQCEVFCPCEFAQKPTYGHCDDTAILHIDKGHYGDVNLDGKHIVVVSQSPKGERLVDTVGNLNFARIFVPENASDEEARALAEMARRVFGTWVNNKVARISPDETIHRVAMDVTIEPHRHRVQIPGVLDLDVQALIGWDGENPVALKNGPAAGPGMGDIVIGRSSAYKVTHDKIAWDYPGRSASMRNVTLGGRIDQEISEPPATTEAGQGHGGHEHHH